MHNLTIATIEWARLEGWRPRSAGCNARLGSHGRKVRAPIARITTTNGASGFGWAWLTARQARRYLGVQISDAFRVTPQALSYVGSDPEVLSPGVDQLSRAIEYPLLDLVAKVASLPVYRLFASSAAVQLPLRIPCYDTSLYIDDLHLSDDGEAANLIAQEAAEGIARGHRAFKIKVGRGALHMPLQAGTRRDIAVIRAVRQATGPTAQLMIDANNGYNLNLTKQVLGATADVGLYWIEEAFHEDPRLYAYLKAWLEKEGLATLIADGEGDASPHLIDWARDGLVDVLQYDIHQPGFTRWRELGPVLDAWGARAAPHNYGDPFGNYALCHLAPTLPNFEAVEWDEATVPGLDTSSYTIREGQAHVPELPGFGLHLDPQAYARAVEENGFVVS